MEKFPRFVRIRVAIALFEFTAEIWNTEIREDGNEKERRKIKQLEQIERTWVKIFVGVSLY